MAKKIHPPMHTITVAVSDTESFETLSTWGKPGDTLHLDMDYRKHPAWTGEHRATNMRGRVSDFQKKYSGMESFLGE